MNSFIFPSNGDPVLDPKALDAQLEALRAYKSRLEHQHEQPKQEPQQNLWNDIETELSSLNDEQKERLMSDPEFIENQTKVQLIFQRILNGMVIPYLNKDEEANVLLKEQFDLVKTLKRKVIKEANQQNELFKEYTEKYPYMSWQEFLNSKKPINVQRAEPQYQQQPIQR